MHKIKGFTLIEMIVAIVVLGVLASIAVPKYLAVRDSARNAVKTAAVNTVRTTMTMLYAEKKDYPTNADIAELLTVGEDPQHTAAEAVKDGIKFKIGTTGDTYTVNTFTDEACTDPTKSDITPATKNSGGKITKPASTTDKVKCVKGWT